MAVLEKASSCLAAQGESPLLANASDERLNRAVRAYLRQEVQAPAAAVSDFLDIIIEDARRLKLDHVLADLERMRSASIQLTTFVKSVTTDGSSARGQAENFEAFQRRLRHDLRSPLNVIKGYSELLIEDMDADNNHPLREDLTKLRDSADQLIAQIDAIVTLTRSEQTPQESSAQQVGFVEDVLRTVQPLHVGSAAPEAALSSRVLVVDDNAANRDVLARRLTREGHQVVTAANGASALELVATEEFDLVLLDLIMPEMNGFDVLRRLKATEHTSHVPVIVISALDELDSVVRCIESGAEDYLTKPFNPVLLRARISASLEKKRLRDRERKFIQDLEQERQRSESLLLNIRRRSWSIACGMAKRSLPIESSTQQSCFATSSGLPRSVRNCRPTAPSSSWAGYSLLSIALPSNTGWKR